MGTAPVIGLIRLDVEDYLTPEADWALAVMAETLQAHRLPASLAVVGEKAEVMAARGHAALLRQLAAGFAIGFHSTSHSRHPTIAEALADMEYEEGLTALVARERAGVEAVARWLRPPRFFTQPGGNWVPHAIDALPALGMRLFFGEDWNSYLVARPFAMEWQETVVLSPPVAVPRPFGHALPDSLPRALALLRSAVAGAGPGSLLAVVTHPTELVTREFWDVVNFGGGRTRSPLVPAPLRSPGERDRAVAAWREYVAELAALPGIRWMDADQLMAALAKEDKKEDKKEDNKEEKKEDEEDSEATVSADAVMGHLRRQGLAPGLIGATPVSAAQLVVWLAERMTTGSEAPPLRRAIGAPLAWAPTEAGEPLQWSRATVRQAAREIVDAVRSQGRLPASVGGQPVERVAALLAAAQEGTSDPVRAAPLRLGFLEWVKAPEALHWDWPVFPPGFRPWRLWQETRRLAWSLRPARWRELP